MSNETLFYVCGIALAVSAVLVSFAGLRIQSFPGKAAPIVALGFIALIGATATFAVLHAQDEEEAKAAELSEANKEITEEEASPIKEESEKAPAPKPAPTAGGGGPLQLSASPTELSYDKTSLTAKSGKVTIDLDNPAPLDHNVAIEKGNEVIATSESVAEDKTSVSANLSPGTYTFLCTIPGHAEAGMEGTLVVK